MTFEKSTDANGAATWDEGNGTLKIDLDALKDGNCTFKINAPGGVSIASLACPWVKITETKAWKRISNHQNTGYKSHGFVRQKHPEMIPHPYLLRHR